MTTLTLKQGRGRELTLFAPQFSERGVSASAVMVNAPIPRPLIFKHGTHKYRAPAIPRRGFFIGEITLTRVD
ncbi:hypothetical protein [Deinococcus sp. SL84]|uniref:hypothetical protein n=1 Tax=Deinococcus sp. SL84 TaxID=2994663 RepID=UPI0022744AF7|nr:hypothetical protein [Deinococcus sp. SL84]MCY1703633.1 hypothetical protein [Deinococcus sp. SL84]